ncbi:sensor histidine kinase [Dyadobacter psychrotolerans]|uniref:Histidine kinase n=1 Tax=Dyadobacter psychrotolerans TaxID=2541721 RepID=A0A4R5DA76_9BACT|nr:histidine kinase [Dyadobacter psychrotolerans]TDE10479.1 histidine kinase [Dyadobacter psychrotolerans]
MGNEKPKRGVVVAVHLLAWILLGFVLMFYQPLSWGVKLPIAFWVKQLLNFGLLAGLFYINALVMVPSFLLKNRISAFALWILVSVILLLIISKLIDLQLNIWQEMHAVMPRPGPKHRGVIDGFLLMTSSLVLGISTSLAVIQRWQTDAQIRNQAEKQNISTELALLKAQINPHFFFNTLNNIYSLTYTDVPLSRDAILKLSRMMRYLLYETSQDSALLSQEISFMKDYIELMKLRLQQNTEVIFTEPKKEKDYAIAPMLLLPFIENAFKHGVSNMQKSHIVVNLDVEDDVLTLYIVNQIFQDKNGLNVESGGIGLANTQRRLQLLYGPKHSLKIAENKNENSFQVTLKINLL